MQLNSQREVSLKPRRRHRLFVLLMMLLVAAVATGAVLRQCGGDPSISLVDRESSLRRIAASFAASGDQRQARAELDELGLANPGQLLVSLAEQDLNSGVSEDLVRPMAKLAEALGARSTRLLALITPMASPTRSAPSPTIMQPEPTATVSVATVIVVTATATNTAVPPSPTVQPEPQAPRVVTVGTVNLRGGPSVRYPIVGQLLGGQEVAILGRNESGDWWELDWHGADAAWVAGTVVTVLGPIDMVAVAAVIPPLPPTAIPAPPKPTAVPTPSGPDFRLVQRRLWDVEENGGWFDGPSIHCGEKRQLRVITLDAAGNPLNGVTIKAGLANKEEEVTGSKGPGMAEFVLGGGQEVYVIRDADGREVTSDYASGMTTFTPDIPRDVLRSARYCSTDEECTHFVSQGCNGHFSWDVTFQRAY